MGLRVNDLAVGVARACAAMSNLEQVLNRADSKLGDGDTGSMLVRVLDRMAAVDLKTEDDLGEAFKLLAYAVVAETGSSLGTLFGTALLAVGKATQGQSELDWPALSGLFGTARDTMMVRGRASLGDKTILDGLDAIATTTEGLDTAEAIAEAAMRSTRDALGRFVGQPCRIGRARMFEEKSTQLDDPGMLALTLLAEAIAGKSPVAGG